MPQIKFTDMKTKKAFLTDKYKFVARKSKRGITYFAVAKTPSGIEAWRIVSKDFYDSNK